MTATDGKPLSRRPGSADGTAGSALVRGTVTGIREMRERTVHAGDAPGRNITARASGRKPAARESVARQAGERGSRAGRVGRCGSGADRAGDGEFVAGRVGPRGRAGVDESSAGWIGGYGSVAGLVCLRRPATGWWV
ncbi:hypothetical protein GCM10022222_04310 [Amycolatopsis ultiminotia]|uniref:Uncharacterized protein n=1 Tax=Amycolatopsis ultiminotia TaxID=543629 RepID=A0ABP6V087_9PSEU